MSFTFDQAAFNEALSNMSKLTREAAQHDADVRLGATVFAVIKSTIVACVSFWLAPSFLMGVLLWLFADLLLGIPCYFAFNNDEGRDALVTLGSGARRLTNSVLSIFGR